MQLISIRQKGRFNMTVIFISSYLRPVLLA